MFNRKPELKRAETEFMPAREPMPEARPLPPAIPLTGVPIEPEPASEADSIIGSDLTIEGQSINIRCAGNLRINGSITADLHSRKLVVGQQGFVQGSINADEVSVHGRVGGAINGGRVTLHSTAHVEGDIHSRTLSIEDGATFDGRSRRITEPETARPQSDRRTSAPTQIITPPRLHA